MNSVAPIERSWLAKLKLGFMHDDRRTIISERKHLGPLVIQKPFYPEDDVCHVYLLHPPGGIVGGDELKLEVTLTSQAHALITTPAATKFYRGNDFRAEQLQSIEVAEGCRMEWLPQETIFFAGCDARTSTLVNLQGDAKFIGWELVCLGRPACNEAFDKGQCRQHIEIWREGEPLVIERSHLKGGDELLEASWGMQGYVVMGTLLATGADESVLKQVRESISQQDLEPADIMISSTLINDVLVCRVLANQVETARESMIKVWQVLRPLVMQREAVLPRIWNT